MCVPKQDRRDGLIQDCPRLTRSIVLGPGQGKLIATEVRAWPRGMRTQGGRVVPPLPVGLLFGEP